MGCPLAVSVSSIVSAACLVLAVVEGSVVTACVTAALLLVSVALLVVSRRYAVPGIVPYAAAASCAVGTLLLVYVLNWSAGCGVGRSVYSHAEGLVIWCMTFPAAYMFVALVAVVGDARFNRVLIGGFSMFVSVGTVVLTWVFVSVFCTGDLDVRYVYEQEIAYMFVNLMASLLAAVLIVRGLKGKAFYLERRDAA